MGSRSEEEARAASRKVARTLQKLVERYPGEVCRKKRSRQEVEQELRVRDFQVRVVWASTQLPWDIRMQVSQSVSLSQCWSSERAAHCGIARISS